MATPLPGPRPSKLLPSRGPRPLHPAPRPGRRGPRLRAPPLPAPPRPAGPALRPSPLRAPSPPGGPAPPQGPAPSVLRPSRPPLPPAGLAVAPGEVSRRCGLPREADRAAQSAAVFLPIRETWQDVRGEGGEENCRGSRQKGPPAFPGPNGSGSTLVGRISLCPRGPLPLFPNLSPRILASAPISLFSSLLPVSDLHHPLLPSRSRWWKGGPWFRVGASRSRCPESAQSPATSRN